VKKTLVIALVIGLLAGAMFAPAEAKKKKKRVERKVELAYQVPSPGVSGVVGACLAVLGVEGTACIDIPTGAGETFIKVDVADASGRPVPFDLAQDSDSTNTGLEIFASGCGTTPDAVPMSEGLAVRVSVTAVGGPDCPGVSTTGTVTATLSNLP
jgi:hypothetical protein